MKGCPKCGSTDFDVTEHIAYTGKVVNGEIRYDASDPGGDVTVTAKCSQCNTPVDDSVMILAKEN